MRLVGTVGFLVSLEMQEEFTQTNEVCKALFMRIVDLEVGVGDVGRRFGAWVSHIETRGEFGGRGNASGIRSSALRSSAVMEMGLGMGLRVSVPNETTPLIPDEVRGILVEVVRFDTSDFYCLLSGMVSWFLLLGLLYLTFG